MKKKKFKKIEVFDRNIPTRNYFVVLVVSILVIILTLYARSFYLTYKNMDIESSIFEEGNIKQINESDINYALTEAGNAILIVSYTKDIDIYNKEKRIYKELEKKNLLDNVIYYNINNTKNNKEYINILNKKFPNIKQLIGKAPLIIYIKQGQAIDAINSDKEIIDYKSVNKLIKKYEIE